MRRVDLVKLHFHRELVDFDISSRCLRDEISRVRAYEELAFELRHVLVVRPLSDRDWQAVCYPTATPPPNMLDTEGETKRISRYIAEYEDWQLQYSIMSEDPETAAVASILHVLDAEIDLWKPPPATKACGWEWQYLQDQRFLRDSEAGQMYLFEDESDFVGRCRRSTFLLAARRATPQPVMKRNRS